MSQFNLGNLNSTGNAILIVSAGDPVTLIVNHSTKNTVYIGSTSAVGSGNLLDATPLDPYASVTVNGKADVYAVAANPAMPATVYTYQNAINWTPKAIQPNIVDPTSPYSAPAGPSITTLNVPQGAQGLAVYALNGFNVNYVALEVKGVQSGNIYMDINPSNDNNYNYTFPVLSDEDSQVTVEITTTYGGPSFYTFTWIMSTITASIVASGNTQDVNIVGTTPGAVLDNNMIRVGGIPIDARQMVSNQPPLLINQTLASGATAILLPAVLGRQYFIHNLRIEGVSAITVDADFQDTSGATFATLFNGVVGVPANAFRGPMGDNGFSGAALASGLGLQVKNSWSATQQFVGYVTYSQ